ncbi:MAG TPA: flagellar basal body-associated FliL family protein [Chthonomonadaceae bacterium]|nr:flagellar basal body-associated FliL family protein [Chthonomonadaceae bacterium]
MAGKAAEGETKKKKPLPLIIGVVVLVVALVVGKGVMGGSKSHDKEKKAEAVEVGTSVPLEEFIVNLAGGDHYLRTSISLGMKKGITEEQAKEHIAPMRDAILTVLSAKRLKDLEKPEGREALKEELKKKINEATGDESVVKVYFTAFATQ